MVYLFVQKEPDYDGTVLCYYKCYPADLTYLYNQAYVGRVRGSIKVMVSTINLPSGGSREK